MANERVLIVDHNLQQRKYLTELLATKQYQTIEASTCEEALEILARNAIDLILV